MVAPGPIMAGVTGIAGFATALLLFQLNVATARADCEATPAGSSIKCYNIPATGDGDGLTIHAGWRFQYGIK